MSIERALTALEQIATALTTIAASTGKVTMPAAPEATAPAEAKTPVKRERPVKAEATKPEVVKSAPVKAEPAPVVEDDFTDAPEPMDYEVLKRAVIEVGSYSEQGRQSVIKMLGEYGVKNAKDVAPAMREEFHAKLLGALTDLQNAEHDDESFA